jgi:glutamine synthetase
MNFIEKHGLWNDDQKKRAAEIRQQLQKGDVKLVRLAWADPHGYSRAKMVTTQVLISALTNGYNINVATSTLDSANARTFSSFTRGGGMGLDEMTGSPNLTIVPDPLSYRSLPWAPGVAWIICDEYFNNGVPFHFSPRQQLKRQIAKLEAEGRRMMVGLEIEWYLLKVAQDQLRDENIGLPGVRGKPIDTCAVEPGYSYHSESNLDIMQPVLSALADAYEAIGLPLRSLENEWGPGQVECTFAPSRALAAADNALLFRTATRQICRRMGYFATFMCRPGLKGYYSSGWHLHQSLVDAKTGANLFIPDAQGKHLSALGHAYLGGLMKYAVPATAFACPTEWLSPL